MRARATFQPNDTSERVIRWIESAVFLGGSKNRMLADLLWRGFEAMLRNYAAYLALLPTSRGGRRAHWHSEVFSFPDDARVDRISQWLQQQEKDQSIALGILIVLGAQAYMELLALPFPSESDETAPSPFAGAAPIIAASVPLAPPNRSAQQPQHWGFDN